MSIAVIGAGTMGGGIASSAAEAGVKTYLFDMSSDMLSRAETRAARYFDRLAEKGKLTAEEARAARARIVPVRDLDAIAGAEIVIEAIHENLAAKQALLERLSGLLAPDTIVATNTSALRVGDLAGSLTRPSRFLGMHYFSPAEINPLVELVSGPETAAASLAVAERFLQQTGKTVLRCKDASGFAVNRFFCPYANEAVRLMDEGIAETAQIDAVARDIFDLALGPFAVMNIVKPRIMLNAVQNLGDLGPFYAPAMGLQTADGSDAPWAIAETPAPLPDPVARVVAERLMAAVWLPVLDAISERVATPDDFDLGARLALRFGKPPVESMRAAGRGEVTRIVGAMAARHGQNLPEAGLARLFD
jgi:3-hydroxybutyryl-CoA dehydrogenase